MEEADEPYGNNVNIFFNKHVSARCLWFRDQRLVAEILHQIRSIPALLQRMPTIIDRDLPGHSDGTENDMRGWSGLYTAQAMQIFNAAMQHAVMETREKNVELYELDEQFVDAKPSYLMDKKTVDTLQYFYSKAVDLIEEFTHVSRTSHNENDIEYSNSGMSRLRDALRSLVIPLLFAFEERAKIEAS